MEKTLAAAYIASIIENLDFAVANSGRCHAHRVADFVLAARETDAVVSSISSTGHVSPPDGVAGTEAAVFFLSETKKKMIRVIGMGPDVEGLHHLENVYLATKEVRAGLSM